MPVTEAQTFDLLVIGGGPGGMQAALEAGLAGARVAMVDAAPQLGGQYLRRPPTAFRARHPGALHHGWRDAEDRFERLNALPNVTLVAGSEVWGAERADGCVRVHLTGGHDGAVEAALAILATGASERVVPFPGWDLPGVLTVGAAQALLKWQGVRPGHRVVIAGAGPLLLPVASALVRSATRVIEVADATHPSAWTGAGTRLLAPAKIAEAAGYLRHLAAARVPYRPRTAAIRAEGESRVEQVTLARLDAGWRVVPGTERTVDADALCSSHGFVPSVELPAQLGCGLGGGPTPTVLVDAQQRTDVNGVFAVGELTGVAGAAAATAEGGIAGSVAARQLGFPIDRTRLRAHGRRRAREQRFAAALALATAIPDGWIGWLDDDTLVCRCEEVPFGHVRHAIEQRGARDLRSVKLTTRCGMGYCQGRMCGATVRDLVHYATGAPAPDPTALSTRPIVTPVPLGRL